MDFIKGKAAARKCLIFGSTIKLRYKTKCQLYCMKISIGRFFGSIIKLENQTSGKLYHKSASAVYTALTAILDKELKC